MLPPELEKVAASYEEKRVEYKTKEEPMRVDELVEWMWSFPGPRLLIVNTVYSAAVIAEALKDKHGRSKIEHLSSALCPADVSATLNKVQIRLKDKTDCDWCLVATSCVEAGVDLSFRTGMRERASLVSWLQSAGRTNREGKWSSAEVWDFQLVEEGLIRSNPGLKSSREVLGYLIAEGEIGPEYATKAMAKELMLKDIRSKIDKIIKAEEQMKFPEVAKEFCVIDSDTVTAVVNDDIASRLEGGEIVDPNELQLSSVSIRRHFMHEYALAKIENTGLSRFRNYPEVFRWTLGYDDFIGYMNGVMDSYRHQTDGFII
jgi:CRISPR/Cas system-associated endonuclease/helicase Cas3